MSTAGPPQGAMAPLGGSDAHAERGGQSCLTAGPPQGAMAPLGGSDAQAIHRPASRPKVRRQPVHGVLLLDKPLGLSSNQALQKVKWLFKAEKAGHTGTLDPLATGVLPLCFGAATKFSQQHLDAHKHYHAVLRLGSATSTGDAEGEVIQTAEVPALSPTRLDELACALRGPQQQVPPMYSALKKDGKPLYEYARAGLTVDRESRAVEIFDIKLALSLADTGFTAIDIDVHCSKGTYIRTLGEDIAKALGTVGHLRQLRRTQTGDFTEKDCVTLEELASLDDAGHQQHLRAVDVLLPHHPPILLDDADAHRFLSGLRRRGPWADASQVAVFDRHKPPSLLGTAHISAGELIPDRLLNPLEIQQIQAQATVAVPPIF